MISALCRGRTVEPANDTELQQARERGSAKQGILWAQGGSSVVGSLRLCSVRLCSRQDARRSSRVHASGPLLPRRGGIRCLLFDGDAFVRRLDVAVDQHHNIMSPRGAEVAHGPYRTGISQTWRGEGANIAWPKDRVNTPTSFSLGHGLTTTKGEARYIHSGTRELMSSPICQVGAARHAPVFERPAYRGWEG